MKIITLFLFTVAAVVLRAETVQVVETDRQGQPQVTASTTTTTAKLPDGGEKTDASTSRRNSDGKLVLERATSATTTPAGDGVTTTTRTEQRVDVNGALKPDRQIAERTTKVGENETRTERTIQSFDHTKGSFAATARESSTTRTDGNKSTTETAIQKPTGNSWREEGRVRTTEVKAADGSIQREIIESSRSIYDRATGSSGIGDSLQPQRKIVEHEVQKADGTKVIERQTFRRDVNGDWQPATFSTDNGQPPKKW